MTNKLIETTLGTYGFAEGFLMGGRRIGEGKCFDWNGVKKFISENMSVIVTINGGLSEDWNCTSDEIYNKEEGFIEDNHVWSSSTWATPAIEVCYIDGEIKVFKMYLDGMEE